MFPKPKKPRFYSWVDVAIVAGGVGIAAGVIYLIVICL